MRHQRNDHTHVDTFLGNTHCKCLEASKGFVDMGIKRGVLHFYIIKVVQSTCSDDNLQLELFSIEPLLNVLFQNFYDVTPNVVCPFPHCRQVWSWNAKSGSSGSVHPPYAKPRLSPQPP